MNHDQKYQILLTQFYDKDGYLPLFAIVQETNDFFHFIKH